MIWANTISSQYILNIYVLMLVYFVYILHILCIDIIVFGLTYVRYLIIVIILYEWSWPSFVGNVYIYFHNELNHTIRKTTGKYPQEIYASGVLTIQLEWIFLQRVTNNTGDTFCGNGEYTPGKFLPSLFFGKPKSLSPIVGNLSTMSVKKSDLGILNTMTSANKKYPSSKCTRT